MHVGQDGYAVFLGDVPHSMVFDLVPHCTGAPPAGPAGGTATAWPSTSACSGGVYAICAASFDSIGAPIVGVVRERVTVVVLIPPSAPFFLYTAKAATRTRDGV